MDGQPCIGLSTGRCDDGGFWMKRSYGQLEGFEQCAMDPLRPWMNLCHLGYLLSCLFPGNEENNLRVSDGDTLSCGVPSLISLRFSRI